MAQIGLKIFQNSKDLNRYKAPKSHLDFINREGDL